MEFSGRAPHGSGGLVRQRGRSRQGQALPLLGLAVVALIGFAGLAVDSGYERYQQRAQQSATDAAALAGASELPYSASGAVTAARNEAASNGFAHDGVNTVVTVNSPPAHGALAGNAKAVEVVIDGTRRTYFGAAFGKTTQTIETRASALLRPPLVHTCIYVLNATGSMSLNSTTINAPNCGIADNGSFTANSGALTLASIGVVGSKTSNATTYYGASPSTIVPVTDPCPAMAGCASLRAAPPATSPCTYSNLVENAVTVTLNPGVYCGSTTFNAANVALNAGTYVFTGGLIVNATPITGSGVTLAFMSGGAITMNSGSLNVSAPTSGSAAGMLYYQPPINSAAVTMNASSAASLQGVIYAPSAAITSNASFGSWMEIVGASATLNAGTTSIPNGSYNPYAATTGVLGE